jgi:hypothetical protein
MDIWSHVSSSFDSSGDTSSSAGFAAYLVGPVDSGSSGEVSSHAPQDMRAELSGLKLVLESYEYTLVERSNQLSRMMGELESNHQLALKDRQLELRDRRIAKLEVQLVDVHKGRMKEARGVHSSIRLFLESEKECRQLQRRCQFWRSRALAKPSPSSGAS